MPTFPAFGNCTKIPDPDLMFPDYGNDHQALLAKLVCYGLSPELTERRQCPILEECLGFALRHNLDGVWGAATEQERKRLRRNAKVAG